LAEEFRPTIYNQSLDTGLTLSTAEDRSGLPSTNGEGGSTGEEVKVETVLRDLILAQAVDCGTELVRILMTVKMFGRQNADWIKQRKNASAFCKNQAKGEPPIGYSLNMSHMWAANRMPKSHSDHQEI